MSENIYAIHGLKRKRGAFAGQILTSEQQLKTLRGDLAALDRSLQLLDPTILRARIKPIRPRQRFKFFKSGELPRMLLNILRNTSEPILNFELVDAVLHAKELYSNHRDTRHAVESRVRAALQRLE